MKVFFLLSPSFYHYSLMDFLTIMSYDYHGHWDSLTGHNSPLFRSSFDSGNVFDHNIVSSKPINSKSINPSYVIWDLLAHPFLSYLELLCGFMAQQWSPRWQAASWLPHIWTHILALHLTNRSRSPSQRPRWCRTLHTWSRLLVLLWGFNTLLLTLI